MIVKCNKRKCRYKTKEGICKQFETPFEKITLVAVCRYGEIINEISKNPPNVTTGVQPPIKEMVKTNEMRVLREENEALKKRLNHLLQSDLVKRYDEYDPCACDYKYDIKELDEDYKIKHCAYYLLKSLKTCNECAKKNTCKYVSWGNRVVYNCPHYKE